jgi:putative Mn2+ efflux pump MntP
VDALGLLLVFVGAFMLYEAIKNPHPTPVTKATAAVTGASK